MLHVPRKVSDAFLLILVDPGGQTQPCIRPSRDLAFLRARISTLVCSHFFAQPS